MTGPHTITFRGGMLLFIFWPDFEEVAIVTPTQSVSMSFDQLEATLTKNREERERR